MGKKQADWDTRLVNKTNNILYLFIYAYLSFQLLYLFIYIIKLNVFIKNLNFLFDWINKYINILDDMEMIRTFLFEIELTNPSILIIMYKYYGKRVIN